MFFFSEASMVSEELTANPSIAEFANSGIDDCAIRSSAITPYPLLISLLLAGIGFIEFLMISTAWL